MKFDHRPKYSESAKATFDSIRGWWYNQDIGRYGDDDDITKIAMIMAQARIDDANQKDLARNSTDHPDQ